MLAFAMALVFTAQVEAATQHCARLANAAEAVATKADTPSCHSTEDGDAASTQISHPTKQPTQERCECIAVLSACAPVVLPSGSSRIEPYIWAVAHAMSFVSTEPAPALRPPRA
jgi:hypothetical protein